MAADVLKLREERANEIKKARAILDRADGEKRELTPEEKQEWDGLMARVDELEAKYTRIEEQLKKEASLTDPAEGEGQGAGEGERGEGQRSRRDRKPTELGPDGLPLRGRSEERRDADRRETAVERERSEAFRRYLVGGKDALSSAEFRALQADDPSQGGFLVPAEKFVDDLIKAITVLAPFREAATVIRLEDATSLGVPTMPTNPSAPTWTAEISVGAEDTAARTGKRTLTPHPLAKLIKISETLLRKTAGRAEDVVVKALADEFGAAMESAFMTGDGHEKPLGLFVASSQGISTARDYSTGNTTTAVVGDNLIGAKYFLKAPYQNSPTTRWIFHRDTVAMIRKLKSAVDGQYLWQPGLQAGQPDTLLQTPVMQSEYAPNTFTTGQYVGVIGDLKYYWIVEALTYVVKRLNELFAGTNQIGFIGRAEIDGMPILEEAFTRVKLG